MELVAIVTLLALAQYVIMGVRVGQARLRYGIEAPAITGHPVFERHFRVHQNTLEQLVVFLPALWLFSAFVSPRLAALLGLVFIAGRYVYERGYVANPQERHTGAMITMVTNGILVVGAFIGAIIAAL